MRSVLKNVIGALVTILVASAVIFAAMQLVPGDPAAEIAGTDATATEVEQVRQNLGLDRPAWIRYFDWLGGFVTGDFGQSLQHRQSVLTLLKPRLGATLMLDLYATLLVAVVGIGLGVLAARNRRMSSTLTVVSSVFVGLPTFVAAIFLIQVFAISLGWFPALADTGDGLASTIHSLTLPAIALSLSWIALVAQISRASFREQLGREHVQTAVGRGLTKNAIFRRHVMRNGAAPIVSVISLTMGGLIAGSVVVERAFSIDGVGAFLVQSILRHDAEVVMAITMLIVVVFIAVTVIADLIQLAIDPRLRSRGVDR
ncbi:ABC transporter permease [Mumia zhuanghuii]|uniref:ABC transporter permease n=2 Tax=Mumia TaxID=1546255 RepID=A0ABW1QKX5_9ACTN|nr:MULTISPECIES: ABC transporter permease [Mumia]KAA1418216.1 ABC transporter permease [Mumia zhuanghuii]